MSGHYERDLGVGREAEQEVLALLSRKVQGIQSIAEVDPGNRLRFDLKVFLPSGPITIEVKYDILSESTGNVAVEVECRGHASGVTASMSDYFVFKLVDKNQSGFWLIPTGRLRLLVMNTSGRMVNGGDDGVARMKLLKMEQFKEQCDCRLDEVEDESIVLQKMTGRFFPLKDISGG